MKTKNELEEKVRWIAHEIAHDVERALDVEEVTTRAVMQHVEKALDAGRDILFNEVISVVENHRCRGGVPR